MSKVAVSFMVCDEETLFPKDYRIDTMELPEQEKTIQTIDNILKKKYGCVIITGLNEIDER